MSYTRRGFLGLGALLVLPFRRSEPHNPAPMPIGEEYGDGGLTYKVAGMDYWLSVDGNLDEHEGGTSWATTTA